GGDRYGRARDRAGWGCVGRFQHGDHRPERTGDVRGAGDQRPDRELHAHLHRPEARPLDVGHDYARGRSAGEARPHHPTVRHGEERDRVPAPAGGPIAGRRRQFGEPGQYLGDRGDREWRPRALGHEPRGHGRVRPGDVREPDDHRPGRAPDAELLSRDRNYFGHVQRRDGGGRDGHADRDQRGEQPDGHG